MISSPPAPHTPVTPVSGTPGRGRRRLVLGASVAIAAAATAAAVYRRRTARRDATLRTEADDTRDSLGWGEATRPEPSIVVTSDGARLAVWDLEGDAPEAPVVVLPHCWGCSHEVWLPVAHRLRAQGRRVVLYDQRGHGASTRGTAPLNVETLGHDLAAVLEASAVRQGVVAGHSMGGMTVMSLATHRPDVLADRIKATVLVATAASALGVGGEGSARGAHLARAVIASPVTTRAMRARNGRVFVRGVFGANPERAHMDLTRTLFADCDGTVRGDFLVSFASMNLLEGIAAMDVPTTVMVGTRDTLTVPKKAVQIASTVPGARLVTLEGRGHMLPLEDPDAVVDEIARALTG